jgi:hypothetical protein
MGARDPFPIPFPIPFQSRYVVYSIYELTTVNNILVKQY